MQADLQHTQASHAQKASHTQKLQKAIHALKDQSHMKASHSTHEGQLSQRGQLLNSLFTLSSNHVQSSIDQLIKLL